MAIREGSPWYRVLTSAERGLAPLRPRRALIAAGRHLSDSGIGALRTAVGAIEEGQWLSHYPDPVPNRPDRFAVFQAALERVSGKRPLYLEFGVYRGRTLRWWAEHLQNPKARFVGFDSFEGLPEDWRADAPRGEFKVGGPPSIDDPRVSFVVGWFEETLASWEPPAHDQLIVNVDCDLYSSAARVLRWLQPHLRPGSLVYFDDLIDPQDEFRAYREWVEEQTEVVRPLAMARWGRHLLLEVGG